MTTKKVDNARCAVFPRKSHILYIPHNLHNICLVS